MLYNLNIKNVPLTALTKASSTMTGSFVSMGTTAAPCVMDFMNGTTQIVEISMDGTNIHDAVAIGINKPYVGTQHVAGKNRVWIPAGVTVSARGTAGTGTFYVTMAGV